MRNAQKIIFGIALVIVGIIFALNVLGIFEINIFFPGWWTLFIIIPSFIGLFGKHDRFGSLIGLAIGVALLLSAQNIIDLSLLWKLFVPIVLILIGIKVIFNTSRNRQTSEIINNLKHDGFSHGKETAAFTAQSINYDGQVFEGAALDAVFGSIILDLRNAIFEQDSVITASAIFAGIEIIVPNYVQVKTESNSIFGAVSDKRNYTNYQNPQADSAITLYVEGTCLFGGVDIK